MKVTDQIKKASSPLFSIEILPPLKGRNIEYLYSVIDPLMEFNPAFIDVTYHREDYTFKKKGIDGQIEKIPIRRRPGTVGICAALKAKYAVDTVPHLICGGFSRSETEDALFSLHYVGVQNVLLLRGDALKSENNVFKPYPNGHNYATELIHQVNRMNHGYFLHEETAVDFKTDFCIGVAGYPEKHFEAPNMESDLKYLKEKVDLGADYIVTQLFFDNQKFFDFVKKCRAIGINVPIIPGIKPISKKAQLKRLPSIFHIDLPEALTKEIEKCTTDEQVQQVGIEWAIQQCKELIDFGVPCLHFYTMSKGEETLGIAKAIF